MAYRFSDGEPYDSNSDVSSSPHSSEKDLERSGFFAPLLQGLDVHSQAYYGISLRGIKLTGEVEEWGIILELCNIALTDVRFCDKGGWKEEELETVHYILSCTTKLKKKRIIMPLLKDDIMRNDDYRIFHSCENLEGLYLVGGVLYMKLSQLYISGLHDSAWNVFPPLSLMVTLTNWMLIGISLLNSTPSNAFWQLHIQFLHRI